MNLNLKKYIKIFKKDKATVEGEYFIDILQNGEVVKSIHSKNIITDYGLNQFGVKTIASCLRRIHLGTGTTAVDASDVSLDTEVAVLDCNITGSDFRGTLDSLSDTEVRFKVTALGPIATSDTTYTEVGMSYDGVANHLISRSLLSPAVTELTGQQIRITYQLSVKLTNTDAIAFVPASEGTPGFSGAGYMQIQQNFATTTWDDDGALRRRFFVNIEKDYDSNTAPVNGPLNPDGSVIYGCSDADLYSQYNLTSCLEPCFGGTPFTTYYISDRRDKSAGNLLLIRGSFNLVDFGTVPSYLNSVAVSVANRDTPYVTATVSPFVADTFKTTTKWTLGSGFSSNNLTIYGVAMRGLVHKFNTPITKTTLQIMEFEHELEWGRPA